MCVYAYECCAKIVRTRKEIKTKYYACAQSLLHFLSFVSPVIFSGEFEGGRIENEVSGTSCLLICPLGPTFHKSRRIRRFFWEESHVISWFEDVKMKNEKATLPRAYWCEQLQSFHLWWPYFGAEHSHSWRVGFLCRIWIRIIYIIVDLVIASLDTEAYELINWRLRR